MSNAHLFVGKPFPSTRVSALRLANVVSVVIEGFESFHVFVREVVVNSSRARSACVPMFSLRLLILSILLLDELFGLVYAVEMTFEQSDILGVTLDGGVCKVAHDGNQTDSEINSHIEKHPEKCEEWQSALGTIHPPYELKRQGSIHAIASDRYETDD
jgi:hypothetical protein